uniref:Putative paramyosin n=1 Tax=Davidia involucrata TaxID=16924 RepID=A0A5B6ZWT4_DAVIN
MASAGDEDNDAVLSDVEEDDQVPIVIKNPSPEDVSVERFREVLAELDRERQAREAAENSKSELQVSFSRLKVLAHEAIKKRDECTRQRDEALREKEEALRSNEKLSSELAEAVRAKDEVLKQRDDLARQFDEAVKGKDSSRSEIETAAQMLVTGIEKISGKVSNFKNFTAGGLPRSQKYTGLPAVAYGVIKRTNEIVEELLRQIDSTAKSRNEAREQMEQRNYEIAIEVSQLEATIDGLREEVSKKTSLTENLEKSIAEKVGKMTEMERELLAKLNLAENEASGLRQLVGEYDDKLRNLESKMDSQWPLLIDQLNYVSKIHDQIDDVIKIIDANKVDQWELSESLFLPQKTDMEENIRASLAGMESIYELTRIAVEKTRDIVEERSHEVKGLNETVSQLVKEKEHIGSLLRSALSRRMSANLTSKTNELFRVAENGLREAGIDFTFSNHLGDGKVPASTDKVGAVETEEDEICTLAGALENIIKQSQLEIIELQHSVEELRAETSLLNKHVEAQAKELSHRKQQIEELQEKERVANENVEGLMMDTAAAEEEITRWKVAAQQEAAAGKAVEQEFLAQLSALRQDLEEARQAVMESEKKLKFKEETAAAAMAARDAAEKSLRLADLRASRLRDRVEELTHQLEELDTREHSRKGQTGPRYMCWPWQWLGLNFVGVHQSDTQQQSSNEMELSEPLL